ncbi:hypothetical protein U0070_021573 [Myodes glareolus]|uniref:Interferon/interleukin receptor domain-containing protein n=1 Tax=Myodes glareolus TaxID=447135 RepID=A0AAW0IEM2_MYOGA
MSLQLLCGHELIPSFFSIKREEMENWFKPPACLHITGTTCQFSLLNADVFVNMKVRVRAEKGKRTSSWNEIEPFIPHNKVSAEMAKPSHSENGQAKLSVSLIALPAALAISGNDIGCNLLDPTFILVLSYILYLTSVTGVSLKFCNCSLLSTAHIGPPGVHLEAEDKAILVHISQPGEGGKMWGGDSFDFKYQIVFWQKSSGVTQNVTTNCCIEKILELLPETTYCLKVEAIHQDLRKQSNFSKVQCINTTAAIPPPTIAVATTGESLLVHRKKVQKSPKFTIMNLQPLTVYCVEARVHSFASWNKSSNFSDRQCEKTGAGNSPVLWAVIGLGILFFSALVFCAGKNILKDLSHAFSSPKPPPSIHELFSEPPSKNLLLLTPEEHTEKCFIIESAGLATVAEENGAPEEDHRKYSFQTSQDSGNYSNEEEGTGSESSQGLRP